MGCSRKRRKDPGEKAEEQEGIRGTKVDLWRQGTHIHAQTHTDRRRKRNCN